MLFTTGRTEASLVIFGFSLKKSEESPREVAIIYGLVIISEMRLKGN